jgi:hypothetical protein
MKPPPNPEGPGRGGGEWRLSCRHSVNNAPSPTAQAPTLASPQDSTFKALVEHRIRDLETIADWRDELSAKIRRAELRFEFIGLDPEEQEQLDAEVEVFKRVCSCLSLARLTDLPTAESEAT